MVKVENIKYKVVKEPFWGVPKEQPELPDEVYKQRLERTLKAMEGKGLDYLLIYADREHYGNFDYFTGFEPRFEEAIFVLDKSGKAKILLGNECIGMAKHSRIPAEGILYHTLSLPNQPMGENRDIEDILTDLGLNKSHKVGIVGWKLIYPVYGTEDMFDVPSFIVEGAARVVGRENILNATDLFIHPEYGVRVINSADEIAYFEFGAAYASDSVQKMLLNTRTGLTEIEISQFQTSGSIPTNLFPKVLAGDRMDLNMVSPTSNVVNLGDRFQITMGHVGGQTNRRGFAAYSEEDLADEAKGWLDDIAKPYFATVVNWYENIGIGVKGGEIYDMVENTYPQEKYGWFLNPGHLIAAEEWLSSPIYEGSDITLKSGMVMQMDIIPFVESYYAAPNCEDGIAIADEALRNELKEKYPDVYERIENRRKFMSEVLNIQLKPEILPLSNICGLYRPYMLNKDRAFVVER
ncbi:MAG: aminopeptidase P family N-terminal domain-containing protein [Tissierellaceae bacterium]|jgi:hypothetical protein|nr:hypothetical protein [Tissierellia bacterium]